ncbi:MAG: hypothetical protein WCT02_04515 [Candidatus Paceibacterota bacterium]|jgi:hypothetical protein
MNPNQAKSPLKTYLIIGGVVIVAALAYFYFVGSKAPADTALDTVDTNEQEVGTRVFSLLGQINAIRIDTTFFAGPVYKTLKDNTVEVVKQPVGRPNPFAPIPGVSNPNASETKR